MFTFKKVLSGVNENTQKPNYYLCENAHVWPYVNDHLNPVPRKRSKFIREETGNGEFIILVRPHSLPALRA